MRRLRQTKIVATIGPASGTDEMLAHLFQAGADVFRFNFSHGTHEEHAAQLKRVRALEERVGRPIGVLADLQGPKLRVGRFANSKVSLETGNAFRLDLSEEPGCVDRVQLPHPEIFEALRPGAKLLLDDGRLCLGVTACGPDFADTKVVTGGTLSNNKGVNLPDVVLDVSPLTEKDRRDLRFALEIGISLIALSFVQRPEDVEEALGLIDGRAHLISKLEKPSAIEKLEEIVDLTDGVMVARGDLGVELPPEMVPAIQKRIIRACRQAGKPVIVATQMLDSMITAPTPTRAETSDVANAVYEGADAVMLSGETAVGQHPVAAVSMMDRIIKHSENDPAYPDLLNAGQAVPRRTTADTITESASRASATLPAAAIVTFTISGVTALRASRRRPLVPILVFTPTLWIARNLSGVWGVHTILAEMMNDHVDMDALAVKVATEENFAKSGDHLVITAGLPLHILSPTNVMRLVQIQHVETERVAEVPADIRV
ncbi:MAG: pyruvate kinase [Rhodospirillales bacterium]|nr:pyruvate kinase [Rhodospirillales bacterium]